MHNDFKNAVEVIKAALNEKPDNNIIIAIDGPCASGKTTLAKALKESIDCNVIAVDDFFLQPAQRTRERLSTPGGNFDKERLLQEVILPLQNGTKFSYRPFDCKACTLLAPIEIEPKPVTIIEGVYSCHPELQKFYSLMVFVKTDKEAQLQRLTQRSPQMLSRFIEQWIPMEKKYFNTFGIEEKCPIVIKT